MGRKERTRRMQKGAGLALLFPLGPPVLKPNLESEEEETSVRWMRHESDFEGGVQKWKVP